MPSKVFCKSSKIQGGVGLDSPIKASVSLFSRRPWLMLGTNMGNGFFLLIVHVTIFRVGGPGTVFREGVSH